MPLTLGNYIRDLRIRLDDSDTINQYFTDADLTVYLNNARRKIALDLELYENQTYIIPSLYIDEYSLPNDFISATLLIDSKNEYVIPPLNKGNIENSKDWLNFDSILGSNYAGINENRRTITFFDPPDHDYLEPKYNIKTFSRSGKYLIVDGLTAVNATGTVATTTGDATVTGTNTLFTQELIAGDAVTINTVAYEISSITTDTSLELTVVATADNAAVTMTISRYTFADIMDWDDVKGIIKLTSAAGAIEYARVSKIVKSSTTEYTLYISSWDLFGIYKNSLLGKGTVNVTASSSVVRGNGTVFQTEFVNANVDTIVVSGQSHTVNTITNNTYLTVNSNFTSVLSLYSYTISNNITFADNDTIQYNYYKLNYKAIPTDLQFYNEYDKYPNEAGELIVILASVEAELQRSRNDYASKNMEEYKLKVTSTSNKLNKDIANQHNQKILYRR